jgi:hypothetical protein
VYHRNRSRVPASVYAFEFSSNATFEARNP